jgi:hypothetical protein
LTCKLCKHNKKTVKSHIIPESFYRDIKESDKPLIIISGKEGEHTKRSQIGLYDPNILCDDCEKSFHQYDDYGIQVILKSILKKEPVTDNNETIGYEINGIDYKKFKLFFMSILWRAGISSMKEFNKVDLGSHLMNLEDKIKSDNPGTIHDFAVLLTEQKFLDDMPIMVIPHKVRFFDGLNFFEISLGRYKAFIKVDKRNILQDKIPYVLNPDKPLLVPYLDFRGGPFEKIVRDIFKANRKPINNK